MESHAQLWLDSVRMTIDQLLYPGMTSKGRCMVWSFVIERSTKNLCCTNDCVDEEYCRCRCCSLMMVKILHKVTVMWTGAENLHLTWEVTRPEQALRKFIYFLASLVVNWRFAEGWILELRFGYLPLNVVSKTFHPERLSHWWLYNIRVVYMYFWNKIRYLYYQSDNKTPFCFRPMFDRSFILCKDGSGQRAWCLNGLPSPCKNHRVALWMYR